MDRRKVIKTIGLSAAVLATGFLGACNNGDSKAKKELKALKDSLDKANLPSEKNKKIVNRMDMKIENIENPTELELKHTPEIKIGNTDELSYTDVIITVGTGILHPSTEEHWIDFIELFADENLVGKIEFEAGKALSYSVFKIKTDGIKKIKAIIGCNLHGIWHSELKLN